ncbi:hypothetical protein LCGC14_2720540, partial [marine sediment metagenome]
MPRIRRFHPISHEFNRDPEVRELRRRFGDWMALAWQEMLSIGDKNDGRIKGERAEIAETLAHVSLTLYPKKAARRVDEALDFMAGRGWVEIQKGAILVRKHRDYHKTREHKESHAGTKEASSFLPSLPSFLPKDKKGTKGALSSRAEMTPVELMESWNEICGSEGLPRLEEFTNGRQTTARRRLKRYPKVEF